MLLLAALLAVSRGTEAQAQFEETAWSTTFPAQRLSAGTAFGCEDNSGHTARRCSTHMPDQSFVFDGVTYYVRYIHTTPSGALSFDLSLSSGANTHTVRIPAKLRDRGTLVVGASSFRLADAADRTITGIEWLNTGISWSAGQQIEVSLTFFDQENYEREMRKGASRSGACGSPDLRGLPANERADEGESAEQGLWHCHGDGVYHRHPDWRKAHTPHIATKDLRPTGDPPARPPATAPPSAHSEANPAARTEGFGNWHSHPDGRYHRHAPGH